MKPFTSYSVCVENVGTVLETSSVYEAAKGCNCAGAYVVRFEKISKPATVAFFDETVRPTSGARQDEIEAIASVPR